jgi:hypothetical protein
MNPHTNMFSEFETLNEVYVAFLQNQKDDGRQFARYLYVVFGALIVAALLPTFGLQADLSRLDREGRLLSDHALGWEWLPVGAMRLPPSPRVSSRPPTGPRDASYWR